MNTFLQDLAEHVQAHHKVLDKVTLVFPNRRAILYFRKHLTNLLQQPGFAPEMLTIEEFIARFSPYQVPDKLKLIKDLHLVYTSVMREDGGGGEDNLQSFSDFYFWGEMLLRDFEEVDKYMVEASQLFVDLSNQKEIETIFEFLSEEQVNFLKEFWGNFDEHPSANKEQFLRIWRSLESVYSNFSEQLLSQGLAYQGLVHRKVAESFMRNEESVILDKIKDRNLIFAGFNALTLAEEKVLTHFVEHFNAKVFWDADAYYVNNNAQEAGTFFREYKKHNVLGKTFPDQFPAGIQEKITNKNTIHVIGAAQPIGQVKVMAQLLKENLQAGWKAEETLIVLPDEKMLLPVLNSIPEEAGKLNITMGFPLSSSPMYNFVELLFDLQLSLETEAFHFRPVMALLQHPYLVAITNDQTNTFRKNLIKDNLVAIPIERLTDLPPICKQIFIEVDAKNILTYFQQIIEAVGSDASISDLDKEYAFHYYSFINRLQLIIGNDLLVHENRKKVLKSFQRLFAQLVRAERIPFAGEPLEGLQIMGVLETRNLDYKHVMILSLNEGSLPSGSSKGSYIPHNVRKAYGLPTAAHQDAMYAYLFYRAIQRAKSVNLFYNTETDVLGQGEMSRYLQQLIFESGLTIQEQVLHNTIQPKPWQEILIHKNEEIMQQLIKLTMPQGKRMGLSPSALNAYIECQLRFYFRYVAGIKVADEIEEDLDNRVLGDFLHKVVERFYVRLQQKKKSNLVEAKDFDKYEAELLTIIDEVFREAYSLSHKKEVVYKGQRLVVREIVKRFAERILELDKAYAPFHIEALEREALVYTAQIDHAPHAISITGIIDRIDRKEDVVRIVDYKTGRDELTFNTIESLFDREGKRNKAAFQTLLYALLYTESLAKGNSVKVVPGLINRKNLFDRSFQFGLHMQKELVLNAQGLMPVFKDHLKEMLNELFDPSISFEQTKNLDNCKYCDYKSLCYRK